MARVAGRRRRAAAIRLVQQRIRPGFLRHLRSRLCRGLHRHRRVVRHQADLLRSSRADDYGGCGGVPCGTSTLSCSRRPRTIRAHLRSRALRRPRWCHGSVRLEHPRLQGRRRGRGDRSARRQLSRLPGTCGNLRRHARDVGVRRRVHGLQQCDVLDAIGSAAHSVCGARPPRDTSPVESRIDASAGTDGRPRGEPQSDGRVVPAPDHRDVVRRARSSGTGARGCDRNGDRTCAVRSAQCVDRQLQGLPGALGTQRTECRPAPPERRVAALPERTRWPSSCGRHGELED